jgi:hypothetical protein
LDQVLDVICRFDETRDVTRNTALMLDHQRLECAHVAGLGEADEFDIRICAFHCKSIHPESRSKPTEMTDPDKLARFHFYSAADFRNKAETRSPGTHPTEVVNLAMFLETRTHS